MATRNKRQINTLHDTTTGTVSITSGSSSKPQNIGFFDRSFTNTGSSSRRRRRRRLHARARQAAQAKAIAEAQAQAQAQAQAASQIQAEHEARLRAQAAEQARAEAERQARAQREHAQRNMLDTLAQAQHSLQTELAQRYPQAAASQTAMLLGEIESSIEPLAGNPTGQQLADLILQEKARINYLLTQKTAELEKRNLETLSQAEALAANTPELYRHYLESHSQGDPARAQQAHQAWSHAANNAYESRLLAESTALLEQQSSLLSERHALLATPEPSAAPRQDHAALAPSACERLWSALNAPGPSSTLPTPSEPLEKAQQIAKKIFLDTAIQALRKNPAFALAFYSPSLADAERPSAIEATPVSQLKLPDYVDLEHVASVNGSIDVPHRLTMVDDGQRATAQWIAADGVQVGTKVRVRHFIYNPQNNTYEFIRDGDTTPALVWTPIAPPADSSTHFPGQKPALPVDPGVDTSPRPGWIEDLPGFANNDPDDYILVFPPDSGLPNSYVLFKDPRDIPGVATGYGKPVAGVWLGGTTREQGSPIPKHIADQIRGREFRTFNGFREAVWTAIAEDPEYRKQLNELNVLQVEDGKSPFARKSDQVGGRVKFEMHHVIGIAKGGSVYDIDNIVIVTPKRHIEIHKDEKNEQQK